jgi:tRNA threonylcarbamoyladenosine biosynthesis protein TsaB
MNILAFDTSLGACSVAVVTGKAGSPQIFGAYELREREHAEAILPMILGVMAEAGIAWRSIDSLAVTTGPGSFTGVRVGVSLARGLALALEKPVIVATSLELLAAQALEQLEHVPSGFAVAVDARRGEVYLGLFDADGKSDIQPQAVSPERAAEMAHEAGAILIAGGGAPHVCEAAARLGLEMEGRLIDMQPDARVLARLALTRDPCRGPVLPLYLRPPDAKPQIGKSVPRRP